MTIKQVIDTIWPEKIHLCIRDIKAIYLVDLLINESLQDLLLKKKKKKRKNLFFFFFFED
jgi:hypothetical protein